MSEIIKFNKLLTKIQLDSINAYLMRDESLVPICKQTEKELIDMFTHANLAVQAMEEKFSIKEIRQYIESQDSLGDVLYNIENIKKYITEATDEEKDIS